MKTTTTTSDPVNGVVEVRISGGGQSIVHFYVLEGDEGATEAMYEQHRLAILFGKPQEKSDGG